MWYLENDETITDKESLHVTLKTTTTYQVFNLNQEIFQQILCHTICGRVYICSVTKANISDKKNVLWQHAMCSAQ